MFDWRRPTNLGASGGRLAPPRRTPNCVSSQADPADREHYVAPLEGTMADVRRALKAMAGATVIKDEGSYLYAEFRTRLLRFVDDVEFLASGSQVHVRSASRLGRRDFGVNRARVEALRKLMQAPR